MANEDRIRDGGCMCGALRYRVDGPPRWVLNCHCESCRSQSGAPMVTWTGFLNERFRWTAGAPKAFASSAGVERLFCADCGTPVVFRSERWADETHIAVTTLDDPESVTPKAHVHAAEKLSWIHMGDGLPQHDGTSGG